MSGMASGFTTRGGISVIPRDVTSVWSTFGRLTIDATWPFAKLALDRDKISVSSMIGNFHFARADLVSISVMRGFTSTGFRFEASNQERAVVFWPLRFARVRDQFPAHGWMISDG